MITQAQAGMLKRFREALPPGRVLVAVSGGADSTALLHLMAEHLPPGKLAVGHVNHRTRGRSSDADEAFVRRTAKGLRLPCLVRRLPEASRRSEASLREARYAALAEMALKARCSRIATAHTADDQAETILLRIARGTGRAGLAGIPASRRLGRLLVVRPLLGIYREDLVEYLRRHGVRFRTDRSNLDLGYARNRVRRKVLPELEKINPRAKEALVRLSSRSRDGEAWRAAFRKGSGGRTLSAAHVEALERLLALGRGEARLPGGILIRLSRAGRRGV